MTIYGTRRGFLGSDAVLSYVTRSQTPVELHCLAKAIVLVLPSTRETVSASTLFRISWLNPSPRTTAVYASNPMLP